MRQSVLYGREVEIKEMLAKGWSQSAIARYYGCNQETVRWFVNRNRLNPRQSKSMAEAPAPAPKPSITEAVQFDYQAMEDASVVVASLQKLGTNAGRVQILGSEFVTNLIRNGQLFSRTDYITGEKFWCLKEGARLETVRDKSYLVRFSNGRIIVMCEDYFRRSFANNVTV